MSYNVLRVSEVRPKGEFGRRHEVPKPDTRLLYAPVRVGATEGSEESAEGVAISFMFIPLYFFIDEFR